MTSLVPSIYCQRRTSGKPASLGSISGIAGAKHGLTGAFRWLRCPRCVLKAPSSTKRETAVVQYIEFSTISSVGRVPRGYYSSIFLPCQASIDMYLVQTLTQSRIARSTSRTRLPDLEALATNANREHPRTFHFSLDSAILDLACSVRPLIGNSS